MVLSKPVAPPGSVGDPEETGEWTGNSKVRGAREAAVPTATLSRESRRGRMPAGADANPKQSIDGVHIIVSTSVVVTGRSHDDSWVTEL